MSADRKGEKNMSATVVTVSKATTAPNYGTTAATLLEACRTFYQNPENEKAFQEWQKTKKEGSCE